jgi:hypothetical protein
MNERRAKYVLDAINDASSGISDACERLALLLAEARREEYWRLRYKTQEEWLRSAFPKRNFFHIQAIAYVGESFGDTPGLIARSG